MPDQAPRVASAETVTLMVFGIVNQLPQWYRPDGPTTPTQLAGEIADFVLAGLRAGPDHAAGLRAGPENTARPAAGQGDVR